MKMSHPVEREEQLRIHRLLTRKLASMKIHRGEGKLAGDVTLTLDQIKVHDIDKWEDCKIEDMGNAGVDNACKLNSAKSKESK